MTAIIMFRNNYTGGDGWQYYPMRVNISDNCPVCGGKRGQPYGYNFFEDGESFHVNKWDNPCGHIDYYKDVYFEHMALLNAKKQLLK